MTKQTEIIFFKTLKSPVFLGSLILLVLNDHLFKYQFHNFLTGKISDFSGLLCFALFWIGLFPRQAKVVLIFIGMIFIWWKSSYSTNAIYWFNHHTLFTLTRVVDYSDLFALLTLPYAYVKFQRILHASIIFRMSPVLPLLLACIAFVATSQDRPDLHCFEGKNYEVPLALDDLKQRMRDNFYTDARGFPEGSDALVLEYRTSVCGDSIRVQVSVFPSFVTDSTSQLEVPELCLECDGFLEDEMVLTDFEERVIDIVRAE